MKKGFDVVVERLADEVIGKEGFVVVGEFAEVLLAKPAVAHSGAITLEIFGGNARALGGGNFDAVPFGAAGDPSPIKEAAATIRSAHQPKVAIAGDEDGSHGEIEIIVHAGGFIDEEQTNPRESTNIRLGGGKPDDAGAIREQKRDFVVSITAARRAETE